MVDRNARAQLARCLRRLVSAQITNDEFEDQLPLEVHRSRDKGVQALRWAAWMLYNDLHEHRLVGAHAVGRTGRRHIARWVLFLGSGHEYEWPFISHGVRWLLVLPNLLSFGLLGRCLARWQDSAGNPEVWPFIRKADLDRAVAAWPDAGEPADGANGPAAGAT